jgi:hypothetical protein
MSLGEVEKMEKMEKIEPRRHGDTENARSIAQPTRSVLDVPGMNRPGRLRDSSVASSVTPCLRGLIFSVLSVISIAATQPADQPIRVGIIGLDTSHVIAFTQILNDPARPDHIPGARVVAAFKGGSPDVESSANRIEKFTAELTGKWKIELVDSIEKLVTRVDAVLLESVDGRPHLAQVRPVFAARKRVFIDKPLAGSLRDAREIARLSRESGTPFFTASSLRFSDSLLAVKNNPAAGRVLGAFTWGPSPIEPHHPDLFWYGIHSVEALYALMGTGCETVTRTHTNGADIVVGRWKDGRTGTVRGIREGDQSYGAVLFGEKSILTTATVPPPAQKRSSYHPLVTRIVEFFKTGVPPVSPEESVEVLAFMEAADASKAKGGAPVKLD